MMFLSAVFAVMFALMAFDSYVKGQVIFMIVDILGMCANIVLLLKEGQNVSTD